MLFNQREFLPDVGGSSRLPSSFVIAIIPSAVAAVRFRSLLSLPFLLFLFLSRKAVVACEFPRASQTADDAFDSCRERRARARAYASRAPPYTGNPHGTIHTLLLAAARRGLRS